MAINLECLNLIIPIDVIRRKYPGGWEQCQRDFGGAIGWRMWHDDHLLRDGAMNPMDMMMMLSEWERMGLQPFGRKNRKKVWKDCCIVSIDGPTLPCDWIEVRDGRAWLKGTEPDVSPTDLAA